jgi:HD-like signal output (HDOD) protein
MSHTGLGGALAEKWGFPKTVASAIKGHHKVDVHVTNPVLSILCTSLGIVEENGVRVGYTRGSEDQFNIALKRLNLHRKQAMSLVSRVPRVTTCLTP